MLYKFKSAATGDVIMLAAQGDQLMRLLGREPAAKGIFEVSDMPGLLTALQAAIAANGAAGTTTPGPTWSGTGASEEEAETSATVGLRQRLWPMVEMLRAAHAARTVVVWGV